LHRHAHTAGWMAGSWIGPVLVTMFSKTKTKDLIFQFTTVDPEKHKSHAHGPQLSISQQWIGACDVFLEVQ
jgi:fructose 1,6-bisphosphatase